MKKKKHCCFVSVGFEKKKKHREDEIDKK